MQQQGVLLINLGTPDNHTPKAVKRYLREFLNDPRVVDIPMPWRSILVNGIIVPFRYKKSAAAYQQIWSEKGSPLLYFTQAMQEALAMRLGPDYLVALGMRYGNPSIASALRALEGCEKIHIIPLFPQYSSAATGSAIEKALKCISDAWNAPALHIVNEFYEHPGFIAACAEEIKQAIAKDPVDKLVFSYHGLPERHIDKSECRAACNHQEACPAVTSANAYCYRAQCYATTRALAAAVGLSEDQYEVAFQSRLGRTPWIKPYTDLLLPELKKQGVKKIAVVSPSFIADCLETLEEINIRTREQWLALGGENFIYIPCVNASPRWIDALVDLIQKKN